MSKNTVLQIRVDEDLKREVSEIYDELGLDIHTAVRMFLKKSRNVHGIPFETKLSEADMARVSGKSAFEALRKHANDLPEMTAEEIEEEISAVREQRKAVL